MLDHLRHVYQTICASMCNTISVDCTFTGLESRWARVKYGTMSYPISTANNGHHGFTRPLWGCLELDSSICHPTFLWQISCQKCSMTVPCQYFAVCKGFGLILAMLYNNMILGLTKKCNCVFSFLFITFPSAVHDYVV